MKLPKDRRAWETKPVDWARVNKIEDELRGSRVKLTDEEIEVVKGVVDGDKK